MSDQERPEQAATPASDAPTPEPNEAPATGDSAAAAETPAGEEHPIRGKVIERIKTIFDPEIPVDIWELGLIYEIGVTPSETEDETADIAISMTLTSPACPVAGSLPPEVEQKVAGVEGVRQASVEVVWDPPWDPSRMSDEAKLSLNMF
ncbi:MAG: iron-sulfur cluster assembly protein [Acidobacteriota bacterium]